MTASHTRLATIELCGFKSLDEPELGLHPAAITALAGMVRSISHETQVLIATQSPRLVDEFQPAEVMVVEYDREHSCSRYSWLDEEELASWLARYCLSELWEKNVLGGRP